MTPLYGLVLAGGRSRRMGKPKESIAYHGRPEALRMHDLLKTLVEKVFFSVRPDQMHQDVFIGQPLIFDRIAESGPLGALWTALHTFPGISWLLVPVDMPALERVDLELLIEARTEIDGIVAFQEGQNGFIPLPAIYGSGLEEATTKIIESGERAMFKLAAHTVVETLPVENHRRLANINTVREKDLIMETMHG